MQMILSCLHEKLEGWMGTGVPCFLSGDDWAGSGDVALRMPSWAWALAGGPRLYPLDECAQTGCSAYIGTPSS